MLELTGTLEERIDEAIRLAYTDVSEEELERFRHIYKKTQIPLLQSAENMYKQYGGVFRNHYIVLNDSKSNRDIFLDFYAVISNSEKEILRRLYCTMDDIDKVREFAKQDVCPVADIGYYYPAVVYVGENGLLYCTYEFKDEIDVFSNPSEILASYLKNNMPIGIDEMPIKTYNRKQIGSYQIKTENFSLQFEIIGIDNFSSKNSVKLMAKIKSYDFSADVLLNINTQVLKKFAVDMKTFYNKLNGNVELMDIQGHNLFLFSCTSCGHINVFITIFQNVDGYIHEISLDNSFDQTFLEDFSKELFADYGT